MKRNRLLALSAVGLGLAVIPARAQFGGLDTAVLYSILGQIQQEVAQARLIYQGVMNTKNEVQQAANYVRHPQNWTAYMDTAVRVAGTSNGADAAELQRINAVLKATREAYGQFSYVQLSAGDMARMNQLGMQMIDLQQRSDSLNASLQSIGAYQDKVRADGDWGCVSCSIGAHQQ